ncbi:MAG: PAS domain-containing protein [Deltaproteobacteria bacterium]|nr:PAS domain-containing protein [Candidatus Zymogenaceae bacterium]
MRILLIDDDASFVAAFSDMLDEAAVSCPASLITASTEREALKILAETPSDIVFLSLDRPDVSWVGIAERIKGVEALVPVIVITDVGHEDAARRAVAGGALDYYNKEEITCRHLVHIMRYARDNRHNQDKLKQTSSQWRATFDSIPDWIVIVDEECRIVKVNKAFADSFGRHPKDVVGRKCRGFIGGIDWPCTECPREAVIADGTPRVTEVFNRRLSAHMVITTAPYVDLQGRISGTSHVIKDVTERKRADLEREALIAELQEALSRVKTLSGLLPICASCKRIRDDSGNWDPIEVYIRDRSSAQFSHGICPECARKLYPDYYKDK